MWHPSPSLRKHLTRFLIVGAGAFCIDFAAYTLLNMFMNGLPAKALSFVAATQFAYAGNSRWTFEHVGQPLTFLNFNTLYLMTLTTNVAIHSGLTNYTTIEPLLAFAIASATSTCLNFIGQRHWVFRNQ